MIPNKKAISNEWLFKHNIRYKKEVAILLKDETESTTDRLPDELQYDLDKNHKIGMEND